MPNRMITHVMMILWSCCMPLCNVVFMKKTKLNFITNVAVIKRKVVSMTPNHGKGYLIHRSKSMFGDAVPWYIVRTKTLDKMCQACKNNFYRNHCQLVLIFVPAPLLMFGIGIMQMKN